MASPALAGPCLGPAPLRHRKAFRAPSTQQRIARRRRAEVTAQSRQATPASGEVVDITFDIVAKNEGLVRFLPIGIGALGLAGTLVNRTVSGIAPVVDASSSQSRTDVLVIAMSAVLLLTGLQWLSIKPKALTAVELTGKEANYQEEGLPPKLAEELNWAWQALSSATRAKSLVVFFQGRVLLHRGMCNPTHTAGEAKPGEVVNKAMQTAQGNYLANLVLYPGRVEFVGYLPEDTQGVVVQPVGKEGAVVIGTNTVRGISRVDQAWIASVADKLEVSMEGFALSGTGFGKGKAKAGRR